MKTKQKGRLGSPILCGQTHDGITVRVLMATLADVTTLTAIERRAWPRSQAASGTVLRKRLRTKPGTTFFVLDHENTVWGFTSFVDVRPIDVFRSHSWWFFAREAIRKGPKSPAIAEERSWRYIVSISVDPSAPRGVGRLLVKAVLRSARRAGMVGVAYGARLSGLTLHPKEGITALRFLGCVTSKRIVEPSVQIGTRNGFKINRLLRNYLLDPPSGNYGVLLVRHL